MSKMVCELVQYVSDQETVDTTLDLMFRVELLVCSA